MPAAAVHHNSSDFEPISISNLSPVQAKVVLALAEGHTVTAAAGAAGIHRTTIQNWLRLDADFQTAVRQAQREYTITLNDQIRNLSSHALQTLHSLLDDLETPASVRLKAALAILQRSHLPDGGWRLPEPIETPAPPTPAPPKEEQAGNQVARNAPCPCGSGLKYKRCCAGPVAISPPAVPSPASRARAASS